MSQHSARGPEWQRTRRAVLERDGWECQGCGANLLPLADRERHVDHIVPRSRGGSDDPANLRAMCGTCNRSRSDKGVPERTSWLNPRWYA